VSSFLYPANLPGLTFGVVRQPVFNTEYQQSPSLKASALALAPYPSVHFELTYEFLRDFGGTPDTRALIGLFNAMLGRADTFLFNDPDFNTVSGQLIGTSTGSTATRYQMVATYQNAGGPGTPEAIQNFNGTPVIRDNGSVVSGANYTIDSLGGLTFSVSPVAGHTITADFSFYYRCRFDDDKVDWTKFMNQMWSADKVTFTSELL